MKLSETLQAPSIRIPLESTTKEDVLGELAGLLPSGSNASVREQILESVLEREGRMSTGIGQGIAIPHGKCPLVEGIEIAFGIARPPIDFDSLDGEPVRIFFLLVSPPELTGPHIQALAQISRMLSADSVRDDLLLAESAERVLALLAAGESGS